MQTVFWSGVFFIVVAILGTENGGVGVGVTFITGVVLIAFALIGKRVRGAASAATPAAVPAANAEAAERLWWVLIPLAGLISIVTGCHYYWGWSWLWSTAVAIAIVAISIWVIRQPAQAGEVGIGIARGIYWLVIRLIIVLRAILIFLWAIPPVRWVILAVVVFGGLYLFFKYIFWPWWYSR